MPVLVVGGGVVVVGIGTGTAGVAFLCGFGCGAGALVFSVLVVSGADTAGVVAGVLAGVDVAAFGWLVLW